MFDIHKMGRQITELRRARGLSQMQLAELLDISFQAVSNWERGISMPDIAKLPELAAILNTSIDGLFGLVQKEPKLECMASEPKETDASRALPAGPEATVSNEVTLSSLCALAPFVSPDVLDVLANTITQVDPCLLTGVAPFLSPPTMNRLAQRCVEQNPSGGWPLSCLCGLAPFINSDVLRSLVIHAGDINPVLLAGLTPFLDQATVDLLANMCCQTHQSQDVPR